MWPSSEKRLWLSVKRCNRSWIHLRTWRLNTDSQVNSTYKLPDRTIKHLHSVHFWITKSIPIDRVLVGSKKLLQIELKIMHLFQYVWFQPSIVSERYLLSSFSTLTRSDRIIVTPRDREKTFWCEKLKKTWNTILEVIWIVTYM